LSGSQTELQLWGQHSHVIERLVVDNPIGGIATMYFDDIWGEVLSLRFM